MILVDQSQQSSKLMNGPEGMRSGGLFAGFGDECLSTTVSLISSQFNSPTPWPKNAEKVISRTSQT
ncbi:hypothetical protein ACFL1V_09530, partial [Pseudomonadota bacterium]